MSSRRRRSSSSPSSKPAPKPVPQPIERPAPATTPLDYGLRAVLAIAFCYTLRLTWPLWSEHVTPPLLPLVEWPAFNHWATILIVTAATFVVWPRAGLAANVLVGLAAMSADQTRMQPQIFSFWLMMLGTLPHPAAKFFARSHLASLWFFSGFHKLFSPTYYRDVGHFMWFGLFPPADWPNMPDGSFYLALVTAVAEVLLGTVVWFPKLRRYAFWMPALLHLGILVVLLRHGWNTSVWPWNVSIAVVGPVMIYGWRESYPEERRRCGAWPAAAGIALFCSPLLYYAGLLDAYLSYCLYSANVPIAEVDPIAASKPRYMTNEPENGPYWKNLNVPQPPTHRNFELYFRRTAQVGDAMRVADSRWCAKLFGYDRYEWRSLPTGIERLPLPPNDPSGGSSH